MEVMPRGTYIPFGQQQRRSFHSFSSASDRLECRNGQLVTLTTTSAQEPLGSSCCAIRKSSHSTKVKGALEATLVGVVH
jgi:hypothetical protein